MPLSREKQRLYMRERRAKAKAERKAALPKYGKIPPFPADPAAALAKWSRRKLKIPPGHPNAGKPLILPDYIVSFVDDVFKNRESFLCIGRKNAKSAGVAVFLLARLCGPLRIPGYRAGVTSVSKEKAGELKMLMQAIAEASGLTGIQFLRSPAPGHVLSAWGGRVDILSADKSAGHASGYDDALIDEIGLLDEKHRELVSGMRSSTSARDGRFIALSIQGAAPFTKEMIERAAQPGIAVHHYAAPESCALDDENAWCSANPGLAVGIKSMAYMRDEARRVALTPADQNAFRAFDLNQPQSPSRVLLCDPADWRAVEVDILPARSGRCVVGFDLGGSSSMTAAAALWLDSYRLEVWAAFPDTPNLYQRSEADGCRGYYEEMQRRKELRCYPGRVTNVSAFLGDVAIALAGEKIIMAGADRYRKAEAVQALEQAKVNWPISWRGMGAHAKADGSHDVRAAQRMIISGKLKCKPSLVMRKAIQDSSIRYDEAGNPALLKASEKGRIDALSATVIAAGLAEIYGKRPNRSWRSLGVA